MHALPRQPLLRRQQQRPELRNLRRRHIHDRAWRHRLYRMHRAWRGLGFEHLLRMFCRPILHKRSVQRLRSRHLCVRLRRLELRPVCRWRIRLAYGALGLRRLLLRHIRHIGLYCVRFMRGWPVRIEWRSLYVPGLRIGRHCARSRRLRLPHAARAVRGRVLIFFF